MAKKDEKESITRDRQLVHFSVRTHVRVTNNVNGQLHKLNSEEVTAKHSTDFLSALCVSILYY